MGKQKHFGKCRICGNERKLTFEHVPPGATYNKRSVKMITLADYLEADKNNNSLPWDVDVTKGKIYQRGKGDYYLCEECNNNTGSWYGKYYKEFIDDLMYLMVQIKDKDYKGVQITIKNMRPLAIYKQVMTMFCDINPGLASNDPELREYILNRYTTSINTKRYRLFMYLMKGGIEKTAGIMAEVRLGEKYPLLLSEIAAFPVGFVLYLDAQEDFTNPLLTEITSFSECSYENEGEITLGINIFENNTWLPADFRSKQEILDTIEKSKVDLAAIFDKS